VLGFESRRWRSSPMYDCVAADNAAFSESPKHTLTCRTKVNRGSSEAHSNSFIPGPRPYPMSSAVSSAKLSAMTRRASFLANVTECEVIRT
jgi:hypothetical protein